MIICKYIDYDQRWGTSESCDKEAHTFVMRTYDEGCIDIICFCEVHLIEFWGWEGEDIIITKEKYLKLISLL